MVKFDSREGEKVSKRGLLIIGLIVVLFTSCGQAAPHKPRKLKVHSVRNLDFGYLYPSQPEVTIDPVNPQWGMVPGELLITGVPLLPFQVELPSNLILIHGRSSIPVYNFTTNLANNQGQLDTFGKSTVRIGATVGSIPANLIGGKYKGRCKITVYYLY